MVSNKEKYQKKMSLIRKSFEQVIATEMNNAILPEKSEHNITDWLAARISYIAKRELLGKIKVDRINIYTHKRVKGIFNSRKYNIVIEDKATKKILCVINIQKILYNINTNFSNMFKDAIVNTMSLKSKDIPIYTIIILPSEGYKTSENGFSGKEVLTESNIRKLLNANTYIQKSKTKIILLQDEVKGSPLGDEAHLVKSLDNLILFKPGQSLESRQEIEYNIMVKQISELFGDIYNVLNK